MIWFAGSKNELRLYQLDKSTAPALIFTDNNMPSFNLQYVTDVINCFCVHFFQIHLIEVFLFFN